MTKTDILFSPEVIAYCEKVGIYELHSRKYNTITYYSYYGSEGFYRITRNLKTGHEVRKQLRYAWNKPPKFLLTKDGATKYNYFVG